MSVIVFVVIGSIVSLVLVALAIFTGYVLYGKYTEIRNNSNIGTPIQEIHCDDIRATAITLSQNRNEMDKLQSQEPYHFRKRSQSDPDILFDSVVAVAIESPDQNTPESAKSEVTAESVESTESLHTDDDFENSVSPLSSPNCQSNCKPYENTFNRHHRSRVIPEITEVMIQEAITILDETTATHTMNSDPPSSSSFKLLTNDINQIINTIDDDEEDEDEEKDEEQDISDRVAITRMIIGPDVRIISDESRSSVSIQSTNLSYSTDESQYAGFMKKHNNQNETEEKKSEEDEIIMNDFDDNEDISSSTMTYDNINNDYNNLHGVKAVPFKNSPFNQTVEGNEIIMGTSSNTSNRLGKLSEVDESQNDDKLIGISDADIDSSENGISINVQDDDEDDNDDRKLMKNKTPHLKQKISAYKQNIKNLEKSSGQTQRRQSVAALKVNRVVKSRRPLFENSNNSSS